MCNNKSVNKLIDEYTLNSLATEIIILKKKQQALKYNLHLLDLVYIYNNAYMFSESDYLLKIIKFINCSV